MRAALQSCAPGGAEQRARIEFARTPDRWDLALHRYPSARTDLPPVLLCPGYACNRNFIDFDERYSLARFLARRGFEAWVLELRGHGFSEPAGRRKRAGWTFDDLVEFDVPTAIAYVRERCGGRPLVWIGHSMGGMVAYGALAHNPELQKSTAGLVTLASPVAFPRVASQAMRLLGRALLALPYPGNLPQHKALVALWWMLSRSPRAIEIGMNPENVDPDIVGRVLRASICNVPRSMLHQLAQWSLSGRFQSLDGSFDYRAGLARIAIPVFVTAGAVDRLATAEMVRVAHAHASSSVKQFREFGVASGDSADYGHVDLILGRHAPEEVFPAISTWIEDALIRH